MKKDFNKIRFYFFIGLLLAVTAAFLWVIRPLVYPIFWAGILGWLFYPLYKKIYSKLLPHKSIASFFTVCVIVLICIIPLIGAMALIVQQSIELYQVSEEEISNLYERAKLLSSQFGNLSILKLIEENGIDLKSKVIEYLRALSGYVVSGIAGFTSSTIRFVVGFFIMLYTLYYFLKDGEWMIQKILHLSPLDDKSEKVICEKFTSAIRATMKGTFLVAAIQGAIGGMVFWMVGIVAPAFWALIMTIFAFLPSVAPGAISFPAALILLLQGKIWQGMVVLIFGVAFVGVVDNILRPYLVGRDIHMHPLMVFFSTVGGLIVFGISGFVIGPILASLVIAFYTIYEHRFRRELDHSRIF